MRPFIKSNLFNFLRLKTIVVMTLISTDHPNKQSLNYKNNDYSCLTYVSLLMYRDVV